MFTIHDCSKTILAKDYMLTMDTRKSRLNNNICLVGASGRGKTRGFIKPNIMQMNSNYVISDPKGALVLELGDMLEAHGYCVKVLNLLDMEKSNSYNPFKYINCAADVYKLIDYLVANVNPAGLRSLDPFWDNASKALLSAICFYLYFECRPEDRTFGNVMKLLRCLDVREDQEGYESTLDVMFRSLKEVDPEHIAVKQYQVFKSAAGRTAKSIQISTEVWLQYFNLDEYDALTSSDNIDLESIGTEKTALFVVVSDTDRSKNWLAGIFYCQLFDVLCNYADTKTPDHRLPIHMRFILDDFACTAKIPDFDYKLAMIRSREISCVVAIQDEAQLEKEYWKAAQGIIANCDSYVFLGSSNIDSCNIAARRLGKPEITGSDIRCMDYDECLVICGNEGGIYEKFDIKTHPRYYMIADKSSAEYYALAQKHRLEIKKRMGRSCTQGNTVLLKEKLFDSKEEEYLYSILCQISNMYIYPHQHLRDVFRTGNTAYSMKLSYMHCDFVIRDEKDKVLFAIEIDGLQHVRDSEQIANDKIKDNFFEMNKIPLLRFKAYEVRNHIGDVIARIISTASQEDKMERVLEMEYDSFDNWCAEQQLAQEREKKDHEEQCRDEKRKRVEERRRSRNINFLNASGNETND